MCAVDTFALLLLSIYNHFDTFPGGGGWVGKIKIKNHLSPAKAEIRAELGNTPCHVFGRNLNIYVDKDILAFSV